MTLNEIGKMERVFGEESRELESGNSEVESQKAEMLGVLMNLGIELREGSHSNSKQGQPIIIPKEQYIGPKSYIVGK